MARRLLHNQVVASNPGVTPDGPAHLHPTVRVREGYYPGVPARHRTHVVREWNHPRVRLEADGSLVVRRVRHHRDGDKVLVQREGRDACRVTGVQVPGQPPLRDALRLEERRIAVDVAPYMRDTGIPHHPG